MGITTSARQFVSSLSRRYGYEILPKAVVYDWQIQPRAKPSYQESPLPAGAAEYLHPDNPRLLDLERRYASFNTDATAPLAWKAGHVRPVDLQYFRGDNAWVWQLRGPNMNVMAYALAAYYVRSIDRLGLLDRLQEDDYFGSFTYTAAGKKISRDLLDSINEIYFLDRHLQIASRSGLNVLDIGAGYGRLAYRMATALPSLQTYFCTDAVAVSTFISEYYLRFRELGARAQVIPLDEIEATLDRQPIDLAVNIHSFSECRISAIEWWLAALQKRRVKHLMIVPNNLDHGGQLLLTNDRQDIRPVVEQHGYRLIARDPKFLDPIVQEYAINPTYYYLFELA